MSVRGLDHVSVTCRDLEESLRFYRELLGIPLRERGELRGGSAAQILGDADRVALFADLELGARQTLELLQFVGEPPPEPPPRAPGPAHLCLRVDDVKAVCARLRKAGFASPRAAPVRIEEPGFWQGARAFYVSDPNGFTVELIAWN